MKAKCEKRGYLFEVNTATVSQYQLVEAHSYGEAWVKLVSDEESEDYEISQVISIRFVKETPLH